MHHVYIIENEWTHEWYIGYTANLRKRLGAHNRHENVSTSRVGCWKLIYCETYTNKMDALGREKFLKSGSGWRFLKKQLQHYIESRDVTVSYERYGVIHRRAVAAKPQPFDRLTVK